MQSALAWDLTTDSNQITIGICNMGVQLDHLDLVANRRPGYHATIHYCEDNSTCNGRADFDLSHTGLNLTYDGNSHGTFCAGLAAAIRNNSKGVSGVG